MIYDLKEYKHMVKVVKNFLVALKIRNLNMSIRDNLTWKVLKKVSTRC